MISNIQRNPFILQNIWYILWFLYVYLLRQRNIWTAWILAVSDWHPSRRDQTKIKNHFKILLKDLEFNYYHFDRIPLFSFLSSSFINCLLFWNGSWTCLTDIPNRAKFITWMMSRNIWRDVFVCVLN